jgi:hypothetical protein
MGLADIIQSSIEITNARLSSVGFGIPLILPASVPFAERLKYYSSTDEMLDDGFTTADLAYVEAASIQAQKPHPPRWAVGKRGTPVAMVQTLIIDTAVDGHEYAVTLDDTVNSETYSHTANGSSTTTTIATALRNAVQASAYIGVTGSGSGVNVVLTADTAGVPFTVVEASANMHVVLTTANVGIPEDIAAIEDYDPSWWALFLTDRDVPSIMTAAASVEGREKKFFAQSNDAGIIDTTDSSGSITSASDVMSRLKAKNYFRTSLWFYDNDATAHAIAVAAGGLANLPGSRTWMFKETIGTTAQRLTTTQRANLVSKNGNGYEPIAGRSITYEGKVASGEFIDIIHGRDALNARITELSLLAFLKNPKVAYTSDGIGILAGCVASALEEFSRPEARFIARSRQDSVTREVQTPAWTVTPPQMADIADADRALRRIPAANKIQWEASLAGAIHAVQIGGTVSV